MLYSLPLNYRLVVKANHYNELEFTLLGMSTSSIGFRGLCFPYYSIPATSANSRPKSCTCSRLFLPSNFNYSASAALSVVNSKPAGDLAVSKQIISSKSNERLRWYSEVLRICSLNGYVNEGRAIHGQVIKKGIDPDSHLWISLVNVYAKCGSSQSARLVFDEMPAHDVVSWTALISGFVAEGHGSEGIGMFYEMRKEGVRANEFTFVVVLKACSICLDLDFGKQVHAEVIKAGPFVDIFVGSALVDLYAKCGEVDVADKVFFCMPEKNVVSWNALLNGYAQIGDGETVWELFCRMIESDIKFSKFTFSTVLKGCANSGSMKDGQVVHSLAIKVGNVLDDFLSCSLVDMYSKCGLADDALKVFKRIKDPDTVTWSAMITCLNQQGRSQEAIKLFYSMRHANLRPNHHTLACLVSAAAKLSDVSYGRSIHACICKFGFEYENSICNALITIYMKTGAVHDGCRVFEAMTDTDLVSWNALLSGFHDDGICDRGARIFCQILLEGFKPNMYTFISILRSCSSLLNISFGKQVHTHIIKNSLDYNSFVGTALVDMYARGRCMEDADLIFYRLNERDLFTWTAIISGYAHTDQGEKALKCLIQMQREGVIPNEFTLASSLSGCSSIATLESGCQLHSLAMKAGHLGDVFVASALVDMYAKCGCIDGAEAVFEGLNSRDTVLWNTILCAYSQHGMGVKALEAFRIMLDEGIMPDEVTFIGVLSACSHVGLIEEGKMYFNSMNTVYGISPIIEHYACMVDILGRAGRLDEVENFIEEMKVPTNVLIWETLLGACKIHGNVELGEKVAEKLFELEPEVDSNYVLLSNIFAAKGRWEDVKKVRALMSSQNVKKEPGCSWVEVNAQVHVFLSQDHSHPMIREIYLKLEELTQKLISIGYIPDTQHVLHNVAELEKKENLFYHSERLALAFALISTNIGQSIRIFKNLRICEDCHSVMKLISSMTNREIVVRDVSRFHHFKNGICSCQDFW